MLHERKAVAILLTIGALLPIAALSGGEVCSINELRASILRDDCARSGGAGGSSQITVSAPIAHCTDRTVWGDENCEAYADLNDGSLDPDGGALTFRQIPPGPYTLGLTAVLMIVTDDEGLADSCQGVVAVYDALPPQVACPGNFSCVAELGLGGAYIELGGAIATDNCGLLATTLVPPSGSFFPVGTTLVLAMAMDYAELTDTCSFEVTVVCDCIAQADLDGNGLLDAVDLAITIDIVYFGSSDTQDPDCPATRADFNADGLTDAVDLAFLIDHVFFGGPGPVDPCL